MTRSFTEIGNRVPLHATGIGKVLLAWLQATQRDALARRIELHRFTPTTLTDAERLVEELATIRRQGYARDDGEMEEGVRCIAVPVRDSSTHVVAALSVSGPSSRLTEERLLTVIDQVGAAGEALSSVLGYRQVEQEAQRPA
jgi:DNA-binding IclR family transcriptional regulator